MPRRNQIWYAAYTKFKAEKKVAQYLGEQGFDHFLPLIWTLRQWSDRKKKVQIPLIKSYIFVHVTEKERLRVLQIPGVVKIVSFGGKPVPIPDWQIQNLKILIGAEIPVSTDIKDFERGEQVIITSGSLKGQRGTIIYVKGQRKLAISIEALDYNLTIDIDKYYVETANAE